MAVRFQLIFTSIITVSPRSQRLHVFRSSAARAWNSSFQVREIRSHFSGARPRRPVGFTGQISVPHDGHGTAERLSVAEGHKLEVDELRHGPDHVHGPQDLQIVRAH